MSVGLRVGRVVEEVGTPAFLNAFFATVVAVAEGWDGFAADPRRER